MRDNIQHHIERGQPTSEFEAIHGVAQALGGKRVLLDARQLRSELERAAPLLRGRPIGELAISLRTRAVIDHVWPPPSGEATSLVSEAGLSIPWLSEEISTLDEAFGHLIRDLLEITAAAGEADVVEVKDL